MQETIKVSIGIQARSTSERLPRKCFELIGDKPLLQHVIDACESAAHYHNKLIVRENVLVNVALLVPAGDELIRSFRGRGRTIIEGDEKDVLSRYVLLASRCNSDYVVRVTGDCPLIPHYLISKHITYAIKNQYDYVSNVDPRSRTSPDGHDCEVISRNLLEEVHKTATSPFDREHVTTFIRSNPPVWAKTGGVIGTIDLSGLKLSVDTQEDLERVRTMYEATFKKQQEAQKIHGKHRAHKF